MGVEERFSSSEIVFAMEEEEPVVGAAAAAAAAAAAVGVMVKLSFSSSPPFVGVGVVDVSVSMKSGSRSPVVAEGESLPGTSRPRLCLVGGLVDVLGLPPTFIGNRVDSLDPEPTDVEPDPAAPPPVDLSRRCCLDPGAGDVALERSAIARFRASMFARRLLSSVLIARGRASPEPAPREVIDAAVADDWRFSSPKMASLCWNKSRMRR